MGKLIFYKDKIFLIALTNCHKFSSLKQHIFIISQFYGSETLWAWLVSLFQVSFDFSSVGRAVFSSEGPGEDILLDSFRLLAKFSSLRMYS